MRRRFDFVQAIRRMGHPLLILATLRSRTLDDLRSTVHELRSTFGKLLQRKVLRGRVRALVGVVHPKLDGDGHYWTVHAHVVLDVDAVPWGAARAAWSCLSGGRGRFDEDRRPLPRRSSYALASYLAKGTDACPAPGTLPLPVLAVLWRSLYRVQLVMRRGPDVHRGRSRRGGSSGERAKEGREP